MLTSILCILLLCLMVLFTQSQDQEKHNKTSLEFDCPMGRDKVYMEFFEKKTEYYKAKKACKGSALLPQDTFNKTDACIKMNLETSKLNPVGVWTAGSFSDISVTVFNMTHNSKLRIAYGKYSYICAKQDVAITSFTLYPGNGANETPVDSMSSACGFQHVYVTKGNYFTLRCEATGIPSAEIRITSDHIWENQSWKYNPPSFDVTKTVALFQLKTIGSERILTCKDRNNKTSISILVKTICNNTNRTVMENCLAGTLPYTTTTVTKTHPCDQTTTPLTNINTDVTLTPNCQGDGAPNCGNVTKGENAQTNTTQSVTDLGGTDNNQLDTRSRDDHLLDGTIPVALVTGAIVAAVCSLVFVCGVFVYRKRRVISRLMTRPIDSNRSIQLQDDEGFHSTVDMVDLTFVSQTCSCKGRDKLARDTPLRHKLARDTPRRHTFGRNKGTSFGYIEPVDYVSSVGHNRSSGSAYLDVNQRSYEYDMCSGCTYSNLSSFSFQTVVSEGHPSNDLVCYSSIGGDLERTPKGLKCCRSIEGDEKLTPKGLKCCPAMDGDEEPTPDGMKCCSSVPHDKSNIILNLAGENAETTVETTPRPATSVTATYG